MCRLIIGGLVQVVCLHDKLADVEFISGGFVSTVAINNWCIWFYLVKLKDRAIHELGNWIFRLDRTIKLGPNMSLHNEIGDGLCVILIQLSQIEPFWALEPRLSTMLTPIKPLEYKLAAKVQFHRAG